ncbi:MAG TPA: FAD-dependent oxidoreductase [Thermoanaerobaculia bacterium]|jgi:NADPH-dependent glutamate synthase beta subunit-like oxidoreductase/NAD(P)H-flavin reductase
MRLGLDGFDWQDLRSHSRLGDLALAFDRFVEENDAALFARFDAYRHGVQSGIARGGLDAPQESALLIEVSRELGSFITRLFHIEQPVIAIQRRAARDSQVARFKREFVAKRVTKVKELTRDREILERAAVALIHAIAGEENDRELALAVTANRILDLEKDYPRGAKEYAPSADARAALDQLREHLRSADAFSNVVTYRDRIASSEAIVREAAAVQELGDLLVEWCALAWKEGRMEGWTSFRLPRPLNFDKLVPVEAVDANSFGGPHHHFRRRDAFHLTDTRMTAREITDEAHYCIYCHERKKDSCSKGFLQPNETYKPNPLGMALTGCPLDEKIGEMNFLRAGGASVAALAVVMIDNPMCPGTGHRICNDCMRACIFQKQDPVNIPQIETGVLTDVLFLPYGFEIYSLLTMWNPVNVRRPIALPYNGKNVLVVGLGPAGYTLAHYLANEGFGVVAIDGLKLEPLDDALLNEPIRHAKVLWEDLHERMLAGFGGVSEYGITVRWDKNFLKVMRIALARKQNLRMYGGVRFGGTLSIEDAFDHLGFDHIAIAAGAGTPTIVRMKNNLVRGMRQASDFLMALQLTGAFKDNSLANLQVRLPAVVIGGGLTAIDTATELFAYYPVQCEKVLQRFEQMASELGEPAVRAGYDPEELSILDELLAHGRAIRDERERAAKAGEKPNFLPLVRSWGGVTIAYRKSMLDSPAYRLNYEEIEKAFEEGIAYAEMLSPVEAVSDEFGHVKSMLFEKQVVEDGRWKDSGEIIELGARTVMIAAGTAPNVIYEKERPGTFKLDKWKQFFQSYSLNGGELIEDDEAAQTRGFFTSYRHPSRKEKLISFYGDNHPAYAGNVVKAMASAKDGFPHVVSVFADGLMTMDRSAEAQSERDDRWRELTAVLDDGLVARVHEVNRLTPTIVEVVVRAPFAARHFEPGQFFRLQNFETYAKSFDGTTLAMEALALTGASTNPERGLLSMIVLEMGGSSRLCASLEKGEPVVVMGPTGTRTEIPTSETILLAGGGLGNAVLFSIARALKDHHCRVVYFAGYKKAADVFKRDEIEAATDQVIWSVDAGDPIEPRREQDRSFVGNIVQSMLHYASSPEPMFDLREATRVIAIGSDGMMRAVRDARHALLAPYLSPNHIGIGSINSPMQCMMKQVCAQCLQRHVDPVTKKESFVFSCFNQDQHLDEVDFQNLRARLRQNTVLEKLTNLWLTRVLAGRDLVAV